MMRRGDEPKKSEKEEQELLEKLRFEREAVAHAKLQEQAQALAASMGALQLSDVPAEAKKLAASDKKFTGAAPAATVAITLNAVLRSTSAAVEPETAKKSGGGKKGPPKKGGGVGSVKPTKVAEKPPPTLPETRKAIRANKALLASVAPNETGQVALLKAVEAWLLSPQGAVALPGAAKVVEVIYDTDLVESSVLTDYWTATQTKREREARELKESQESVAALEKTHASAADAAKIAEREEADNQYYRKQAETYAQNVRCGNNPNKEEEVIEKQANAALKKAIELHTQSQKVLAARQKNMIDERAELETAQRLLAERTKRHETGVEVFTLHSKPFFEWLLAPDESSEEEEEEEEEEAKGKGKGKGEAVEVS